ncbi:MAG: hypothetical protein EPN41_00105 [Candidimonas sp.]|nr:MAG: hypothetical protein EPN41_00105 [Candidimonas sp.]
MRTFDDTQGNHWEAALLDASYGSIMLLFSPAQGEGIRQQLMPAENMKEAEAQLAALDDAGLRAMLAESRPWDPAARGLL